VAPRRIGCILTAKSALFPSRILPGKGIMHMSNYFGIGAVVVICMLGFETSASAQGVGGIGGTVADQSGAVLPGVTVTLSNPLGSLGGNQTTVTDERGAFQFV